MFFFIVKTSLCALSEDVLVRFLAYMPILFGGGPFKKKKRRQQGRNCLRESRKKFTSGACTKQTSTIKLGRRSLVGGGRVLKRPFMYISLALPSQAVFAFLSQRHNRLYHFILDIMDYFCAGEDQQQTNQRNELAGG